MALLDDSGLPKKKMKQAQLPFCNLAPKSQKRKLSTDLTDEVQQMKIMCKEPESPSKKFGPNKENTSNLNNKFVKNEECDFKTDKSDKFSKNINEKLSDNVNIERCMDEQGNTSIEESSEISLSISDSVLESINNTRVYSLRKSTDSESAVEVTVDKCAGVEGEKEKMEVELEEKPQVDRSDLEVTDNEEGNKEDEVNTEKEEDAERLENVKKEDSKIYVSDKESGSCVNEVIKSLRLSLNKLLEFEDGEVMNDTVSSEEDELLLSSDEHLSPKSRLNTSSSPRTPNMRTTPKRMESVRRKEERERQMIERQAKIDRKKEEKIKLKIEKIEKRKKEKEEREKKRQEEIRAKEEEKKKKEEVKEEERLKREEEKKKKEEERRMKEEERRMKEEEKRKKEEAKEEEKRRKEEKQSHSKALFASFFVPKKKRVEDASGDKSEEAVEFKLNFMPFSVKPDMRLAVDRRRILNKEEKLNLETIIEEENPNEVSFSYISDIKSGRHPPLKCEATWPLSPIQEDHDVIIIESTAEGECIDLINTEECLNSKKNMTTKAKLLQFHDNRRPPYWGTWRKKSKEVKARRPLGRDTKTFDYEIDSDSEWEDEGEGENIENECESGEENDEKEEEEVVSVGENGYILDNTFVPHGYLSDEEAQAVEEVDNDPEDQKIRMTLLKQEFEEEMKSKTERLKPRLLGCVWISNETSEVSKGSLYESLMQYRAVWNEDDGPVNVLGPVVDESPGISTPSTKSKVFPSAVLGHLAKMIHGSHRPLSQIIKEFLAYLEKEHPTQHLSKRAVTLKCKEISTKTYDSNGKPTWLVNADICKEFDIKEIPQPSPPQPTVDKGRLKTFLSPSIGSPGPPKKRVALTTLSSETSLDPSSPVTTIGSEVNRKHIDTPRPSIFPSYTPIVPSKTEETPGTPKTTEQPVKKRVALITLSPKTPEIATPQREETVKHQDTPRPIHPFFKAALGNKSKTVETRPPEALVDLTND